MAEFFGEKLQEIRMRLSMTLFDLAQRISCSSAFLSAIENNRKRVPDDFVTKLCNVLSLTPKDQHELEVLANKSRKHVIVPLSNLSFDDASLATSLARGFGSLSEDEKLQIQNILNNSTQHNEGGA